MAGLLQSTDLSARQRPGLEYPLVAETGFTVGLFPLPILAAVIFLVSGAILFNHRRSSVQ